MRAQWCRIRCAGAASEGTFWAALIPFCFIAGIMVLAAKEDFGQAHQTLQPLIVLGLTLVAGNFGYLPRAVSCILVVGRALDFGVRIWLHAQVEGIDNSPSNTVFAGFAVIGGRATPGVPNEDSLSQAAWGNWSREHQYAAAAEWLRELRKVGASEGTGLIAVSTLRSRFQAWRDEDEDSWGGWYHRNGGEMTFLGDAVVTSALESYELPAAAVVVMFVALMAGLVRETVWARKRLAFEKCQSELEVLRRKTDSQASCS